METSIARIINKNWFQDVGPDRPRRWAFASDLAEAPEAVVEELERLYNDSVGTGFSTSADSGRGRGASRTGQHVESGELVRFLHAVTLSEYALDSMVYYPAQRREATFAQFASEIGWPVDLLRQVDQWWHRSNRTKIFA